MSRFKKIIRSIGIFILLLIIFRAFLFQHVVRYSEIDTRPSIVLTEPNLMQEIDAKTEGKTLNIIEIIEISRDITNEKLHFTFNNVSSNPNEYSKHKAANCIGYSTLFNAIGNYILTKQNMSQKFEFRHLVGKITVFGIDVHSLLNHPFFMDHDFNMIRNKQTNEKVFVDPSVSDYLRIDYITCE